ncbi:MAG: DUF4097 family beta strand repeat-containing protein [Myxococcota bacterium]
MHPILMTVALLVGCISSPPVVIEEQALELPLTDETVVELDTRAGSLDVLGEEGRDSITLEITLIRSGGLRPDQDGIDGLVATLESTGDRVVAESFVEVSGANVFSTDVVLRVPIGFDVTIDDASGEILVTDTGVTTIDDGSGELRVERTGPLSIRDDSGEIEAFDVVGDVSIRDDSGEILLDGVTGNVEITDDSGEIEIFDVDGDVDVRDTSGEIRITNVTGTVTVDDTSGDIVIVNVGEFDLRSDTSGDVRID